MLSDRLVLSFYDDAVGSDNLFGSLVMSVKQLIALGKQPNGYTNWESLYGCQKGMDGNEKGEEMNLNPEMASNWRGQVLINVVAKQEEKPKKLVQEMNKELVEKFKTSDFF